MQEPPVPSSTPSVMVKDKRLVIRQNRLSSEQMCHFCFYILYLPIRWFHHFPPKSLLKNTIKKHEEYVAVDVTVNKKILLEINVLFAVF